MSKTVQCDIVSAEEQIFSGKVSMVVASSVAGDLGILPDHAPLMTGLQPGPVRVITAENEEEVYYVSGGYLEVQPRHVTILADTALRAHDVDEAAAAEAQKQALRDLENQSGELDYTRAAAQLAEAAARLRAIQQLKRKTR